MYLVTEDFPLTTKYIYKSASELEGAVTQEASETSSFHYDSSVEVSGNRRGDNDCDCTVECDCDSCMRCDDCNEQIDYCDCISCRRCDECDEDEEDCECHSTIAYVESCDDCNSISTLGILRACCNHREGAFLDNSSPRCMDIGNYHNDCDYDCGCEINHECRGDGSEYVDGEMVSPPLNAEDLPQWTRENYPEETNTTCGAHQHTSFKRMKYYSIVMCKGFQEYMHIGLMAWAKATGIRDGSAFYKRMNGDVHWCKKMYDAYQQIQTSDKDDCRYRIINYCWRLHGTMEVRVLPAFQNVEYTVSAQKELTRLIEQYVDSNIDSLQHRRQSITWR